MAWEKIHKDGILFDMVADHMKVFVERKHILHISARADETGDNWVILQTDLGASYLIEKLELRKIRLNYLINKIKKPTV